MVFKRCRITILVTIIIMKSQIAKRNILNIVKTSPNNQTSTRDIENLNPFLQFNTLFL